jgi:uncharacterized membrane protein YfcA
MEYTHILTGGLVGLVIGLTGVGGGSLMTPILIIGFSINPVIAVGTDLLYAAITKSGGVIVHHSKQNVDWSIVRNLALGSIPACLLTLFIIHNYSISTESYNIIISKTLSLMLMLTALVILFKNRLIKKLNIQTTTPASNHKHQKSLLLPTLASGVFLGIVVTISSVGAGALGTAILFLLYPKLPAIKIIGTDLAHAVPLTAIAGLGHLSQQHVSFPLLFGLLTGGIPMVYIASHLGKNLPEKFLRGIIASMLFALGLKLAFY